MRQRPKSPRGPCSESGNLTRCSVQGIGLEIIARALLGLQYFHVWVFIFCGCCPRKLQPKSFLLKRFFGVNFSLMAPPSATLVHSLGHNTLGKIDIAVQSVLLAIVSVSVGLRLWSRRLQWISLKLNDLLIIVATVGLSISLLLLNLWRCRFPAISRQG